MQNTESMYHADYGHDAEVQIGYLVTKVYGAFIMWVSSYEDTADGREQNIRQSRVADLLTELSASYLPHSIWIQKSDRKKIEDFIKKAKVLYERFSEEIREQGYPKVRSKISYRVSKQLGPLKREAETSLEFKASDTRKHRWGTPL